MDMKKTYTTLQDIFPLTPYKSVSIKYHIQGKAYLQPKPKQPNTNTVIEQNIVIL